jgi:carboxypeptidase PM20D1
MTKGEKVKKYVLIIIISIFYFNAKAQYQEYVSFLSDYIKYPSVKGNEKEAGQYFLNLCKEKDLITKVLTDNDSAFNFVASLYPLSSQKPNFIFINHIDVVDPGDYSKWEYPPFSGKIVDSLIWGRGAIDNKGMAIAQLAAVAKFTEEYKNSNLPFNVTILAVSGEETGSLGAKAVAKNWLDSLNAHLMLGEGGSGVENMLVTKPDKPLFGTSTSEKARVVYQLKLELNTSGHASVPPGEYAIKEMIMALSNIAERKQKLEFNKINKRSLRQLGKVESGIRGFVLRHHRFLLFRPFINKQIKNDPAVSSFFTNTISITDIVIPTTDDNQFPITVSATLDCRLLPGTDVDKFTRKLKRVLKEDRIKVITKELVNSSGRTFVPLYFEYLTESLRTVYPGAANIEIIFPATSDNSIFRNEGIDVFGIFPGIFSQEDLARVHNVNERIDINVFNKAIDVYLLFLQKLAESHTGGVEVSSAR